jgi:hypothetical protein
MEREVTGLQDPWVAGMGLGAGKGMILAVRRWGWVTTAGAEG